MRGIIESKAIITVKVFVNRTQPARRSKKDRLHFSGRSFFIVAEQG